MYSNNYNKKFRQRPAMTKITNKVYLGSNLDARDLALLEENNITHVLICCESLRPHFPHKLQYLSLPIPRGDWNFDLSKYFQEAYEFIENNEGNCLVHCIHGKHRSPSYVISYVMQKNNWSFKKSFEFVKDKRSYIKPPQTFCDVLQRYEKKLKRNQEERLKQEQVQEFQQKQKQQQEEEQKDQSDNIDLSKRKKPQLIRKFFQGQRYQNQKNDQNNEIQFKQQQKQQKPQYKPVKHFNDKQYEQEEDEKMIEEEDTMLSDSKDMQDLIEKQMAIEKDIKQSQQKKNKQKESDLIQAEQVYYLKQVEQEQKDLQVAMELYEQDVKDAQKKARNFNKFEEKVYLDTPELNANQSDQNKQNQIKIDNLKCDKQFPGLNEEESEWDKKMGQKKTNNNLKAVQKNKNKNYKVKFNAKDDQDFPTL